MDKTKLDLFTICDYAVISQDNKLSIIGMFDQIFVTQLPSQHPQLFIVGILNGTPGKTEEIVMTIKNPLGTDTIPPQQLTITTGPNAKANIIATINNLPINETGIYKVLLVGDGKTLGEKEFGVFRAKEQGKVPKSSNKYTN